MVSVATQPDVAQGVDPHDSAGPAPERSAPAVLARLEDPIEEGLLVEAPGLVGLAVDQRAGRATALVLEGFEVVELLRRLDQGDPRIVEIAQGAHEEIGRGDMVGVQHADVVRIDDPEGVVEIAGLGVFMGRAGDVLRAEFRGELGHLGPVAVVEDPRLVRDMHRHGGRHGRHQDLEPLVVGRDEHGDLAIRLGHVVRLRSSINVPQGDREQEQPDEGVDLEDEQRDREPPDVQGERPARAPDEVAEGDGQRCHGDGPDRPGPPAGFRSRDRATGDRRAEPPDAGPSGEVLWHTGQSRVVLQGPP